MESTRVTRCIFDRFLAGESISDLSYDYDESTLRIEKILRMEANRNLRQDYHEEKEFSDDAS